MIRLSLLVIACWFLVAGCASPKTINCQKVRGTRWVNGKIVYFLEPDKEAERRGVAEGEEAGKGIVIKPVK